MSMPTGVPRIRWSPHSNEHRQQFLRVNVRNHEVGLYDVVESVSIGCPSMEIGGMGGY